MLNLIKKDVITGWSFICGIFILISFVMHMMMWTMMDNFGGVVIPVLTLIVFALCIASSFLFIIIDETSKANATLASLPIARWRIVAARYATSFLMILLAFLMVLSSCYSMLYIFGEHDPAFDLLLSPGAMAGTLAFLFILVSLILPFIFTFGAGRGFMVALSTLVGLQVTWTAVKFIKKALQGVVAVDFSFILRLFNTALKWIVGLRSQETALLLAAAVCAIVLVSLGLSIFFYKRMEL
jgi:hypothetical protein